MVTFQQFLDLCESTLLQSSARRSLAPRGPKKNKYSRGKQRENTSDKAALKKAGFRAPENKDPYPDEHEVYNSPHHTTNIETYKNQTDYASDQGMYLKKFHSKGKVGVRPTAERVRQLRHLRRQMGGTRTSRPVHDVSISTDDETTSKNDSKALISRGKSFKKEVQSVPKSLKTVGAKPGDKVTATPLGVMPGENRKEGAKKRDKIYTKELGARMDPRTGKTIGNMRG